MLLCSLHPIESLVSSQFGLYAAAVLRLRLSGKLQFDHDSDAHSKGRLWRLRLAIRRALNLTIVTASSKLVGTEHTSALRVVLWAQIVRTLAPTASAHCCFALSGNTLTLTLRVASQQG